MTIKRKLAKTSLFLGAGAAKLASIPAGMGALGAQGDFTEKLLTGYQTIPEAVTAPVRAYETLSQSIEVYNAFNTLTAREFTAQYGTNAFAAGKQLLDSIFTYGQNAYENMTNQPLQTTTAVLIAAGSLYLASKAMKFYRTEGRGSISTRLERRIGRKFWAKSQYDN